MGTSRAWALPRLAGRAWWVFAAIWSALLAVCLWSSAMVLPNIAHRIVSPVSPHSAVGLQVDEDAPWPTVGPVTPTAAQAGLNRGDRLLLIDGHPVASDFDGLDRQLAGPAGSRVVLVTVSAHGRPARHFLLRDVEQYRRTLAQVHLAPVTRNLLASGLPYLSGDLLVLVCANVLMVRRSHDPLAPWASLMMLLLVLSRSEAGSWVSALFQTRHLPARPPASSPSLFCLSSCRCFRPGASSPAGRLRWRSWERS